MVFDRFFDDRREWLYDQNLDALRLIRSTTAYRLELSAATTLADGQAVELRTDIGPMKASTARQYGAVVTEARLAE